MSVLREVDRRLEEEAENALRKAYDDLRRKGVLEELTPVLYRRLIVKPRGPEENERSEDLVLRVAEPVIAECQSEAFKYSDTCTLYVHEEGDNYVAWVIETAESGKPYGLVVVAPVTVNGEKLLAVDVCTVGL
ncbi:MAG: hypothetical protein QXM08_06005 [Thermofilaceae archaeon]